jgi:predicted ester cyclase
VASPDISTPVGLLRRWVVDYFNSHDDDAAREFIAPGYTLRIGDHTFAGRDEQWLPAVRQQFDLFPGLGMTVHQVLAGGDRVAAWFSEHGASAGRVACWSGVAIYRSDGERLTGCVAQEDYTTRQRQLKLGIADPVEPPAAAPWDTVALPADPEAEAVVRRWLASAWPTTAAGVRCDDEHITGVPLRFEVSGCEFTELFSSGPEVAFHVQQTGCYRGGLAGIEASDREVLLHCNGIVRVEQGAVRGGRVIRDRGALRARLKAQQGA